MGNICILTDSSVQFPDSTFPGQNHVKIIQLGAALNDGEVTRSDTQIKNFPAFPRAVYPRLVTPTPDEFRQQIISISHNYDEIFCIFHSSHLSPCYSNAKEALKSIREVSRIQTIDSMSIATGLGYLVETAAKALDSGASFSDLERQVCGLIPRIYSVFCIPSLTYLSNNGFVEKEQAFVGEMLELLPAFAIEEGYLTPLEKMHNYHQIIDFFLEFLSEFDSLQYISLLQSTPPNNLLTRFVRENLKNDFPNTTFSINKTNLARTALFGPQTIGIIAIESNE